MKIPPFGVAIAIAFAVAYNVAIAVRDRTSERAHAREVARAAAADPSAQLASVRRTIRIETTAYAPGCGDSGGRTFTGTKPGRGTIAVDYRTIPFWTRLRIPGYGIGKALDTGAAIRGSRVDLWMPSCAAARAWGRRTVIAEVLR